jgi:hypothetical protein
MVCIIILSVILTLHLMGYTKLQVFAFLTPRALRRLVSFGFKLSLVLEKHPCGFVLSVILTLHLVGKNSSKYSLF